LLLSSFFSFLERAHPKKQPEQAQPLIQSTPEKAVDIERGIRCALRFFNLGTEHSALSSFEVTAKTLRAEPAATSPRA
jgi:hypothetical protein